MYCTYARPGSLACLPTCTRAFPATAVLIYAAVHMYNHRASVMQSGKTPSTYLNTANPKWQHSENIHIATEQDTTVLVNIYFHVWNKCYIFQCKRHLKSIGKLAFCLYIVPSACWRHASAFLLFLWGCTGIWWLFKLLSWCFITYFSFISVLFTGDSFSKTHRTCILLRKWLRK